MFPCTNNLIPEIQRRLPRARQTSPSFGESEERFASSFPPAKPGKSDEPPRVFLKWPNDVLLGGRKVAGVLIEAELSFLLVGIGVNVRQKPDVPQQGPNRGRPAACLADFGADATDEVRAGDRPKSWAGVRDCARHRLGRVEQCEYLVALSLCHVI